MPARQADGWSSGREESESFGGFGSWLRGSHPRGQGGGVAAVPAGAFRFAPGRVRRSATPAGRHRAEGLARARPARGDGRLVPGVRGADTDRGPPRGFDRALRRVAQSQARRVPRLRLHPSGPQVVSGTGLRGRGTGKPSIGSSLRRGGLSNVTGTHLLIGGFRGVQQTKRGGGPRGGADTAGGA